MKELMWTRFYKYFLYKRFCSQLSVTSDNRVIKNLVIGSPWLLVSNCWIFKEWLSGLVIRVKFIKYFILCVWVSSIYSRSGKLNDFKISFLLFVEIFLLFVTIFIIYVHLASLHCHLAVCTLFKIIEEICFCCYPFNKKSYSHNAVTKATLVQRVKLD